MCHLLSIELEHRCMPFQWRSAQCTNKSDCCEVPREYADRCMEQRVTVLQSHSGHHLNQ
ncbi:uncharacterized protein CC84DRAFT_937375 [Paraphaeosphaeria sporulosa]|uniref:Uncharacterized protein n=1 Tax=Paraphaeosphaeria sporulosa TaxID=1460663 RepID=A0A177C7S2_9PLEO|nr:uncharacterized protein CC84DRAFT_937375 [Paraphaeosphaeria sporulosa]OAG02899.1 hypothetical protein CC84DRAFT_937375 [Paraphaeosphaeria sporulosa]